MNKRTGEKKKDRKKEDEKRSQNKNDDREKFKEKMRANRRKKPRQVILVLFFSTPSLSAYETRERVAPVNYRSP